MNKRTRLDTTKRRRRRRKRWKRHGWALSVREKLTDIFGGAQDLPDLGHVVDASGQTEVHDADVAQGLRAGQQDVLRLSGKRKKSDISGYFSATLRGLWIHAKSKSRRNEGEQFLSIFPLSITRNIIITDQHHVRYSPSCAILLLLLLLLLSCYL